jgi:hypothetical protein
VFRNPLGRHSFSSWSQCSSFPPSPLCDVLKLKVTSSNPIPSTGRGASHWYQTSVTKRIGPMQTGQGGNVIMWRNRCIKRHLPIVIHRSKFIRGLHGMVNPFPVLPYDSPYRMSDECHSRNEETQHFLSLEITANETFKFMASRLRLRLAVM